MFPVEPRGAVQASAATSGPSQELFRPLFEERERERTKDQHPGSGQSLYWGVRQSPGHGSTVSLLRRRRQPRDPTTAQQ